MLFEDLKKRVCLGLNQESSNLSLKSALLLIWRLRFYLIFVASLGCLLTGYINYRVISPVFISQATIMPKSSSAKSGFDAVLGQLGGASGLGGLLNSGGVNSETQQFQQMLKTRFMAVKALHHKGLGQKLLATDGAPIGASQEESGFIRLRKYFSVRSEGGVLHLSYEAQDPSLARDVLNNYLEVLQNFLTENLVTQSKVTEAFVKERLKEQERTVDEAESRLTALQRGDGRSVQAGRSIESELIRAKREFVRLNGLLDLLSHQYELAQIESKRNDLMFLVIEPPTLPLYPSRPLKLMNTILSFFIVLAASIFLCLVSRQFLIFWKNSEESAIIASKPSHMNPGNRGLSPKSESWTEGSPWPPDRDPKQPIV